KRQEKSQRPEKNVDPPAPPPKKKAKRRLAKFIFFVGIFTFLYYTGLCLFIDIYGHWDRSRPAQAIVILGAKVQENGEPGDSLRARTVHAVNLYKRRLAPKIICTGGIGHNPPTEAEAAAILAIDLGVPGGNLICDMESTNTEENARNAATICKAHHWKKVVAVSDSYHLWRVHRDFAKAGIIAYTSPTRENVQQDRNIKLHIRWVAREGLAIFRDEAMDVCIWGWHQCHYLLGKL
ncbi:MAG TPA: YdcF family protein, partial [Armatimonadota bacterium]|nr:YdcF family protein [Armatimonadota bacterium]